MTLGQGVCLVSEKWPAISSYTCRQGWSLEETLSEGWTISARGKRRTHLDGACSICHQPIRWEGYDTLQMICGISCHHGRVTSSLAVGGIAIHIQMFYLN